MLTYGFLTAAKGLSELEGLSCWTIVLPLLTVTNNFCLGKIKKKVITTKTTSNGSEMEKRQQ